MQVWSTFGACSNYLNERASNLLHGTTIYGSGSTDDARASNLLHWSKFGACSNYLNERASNLLQALPYMVVGSTDDARASNLLHGPVCCAGPWSTFDARADLGACASSVLSGPAQQGRGRGVLVIHVL